MFMLFEKMKKNMKIYFVFMLLQNKKRNKREMKKKKPNTLPKTSSCKVQEMVMTCLIQSKFI